MNTCKVIGTPRGEIISLQWTDGRKFLITSSGLGDSGLLVSSGRVLHTRAARR